MISTNAAPRLSLSIVSHGQGSLVRHVLADLSRLAPVDIEILLTLNIQEDESVYPTCPFPVHIIRNEAPKGFGANHNAAFEKSRGRFFVVVNPDIRLPTLGADQLLAQMEADARVGAVAPVVLNSSGGVEDSVRRFPTVLGLVRRVLLGPQAPDYQWGVKPIEVDWTAGMFVVFRREAFEAVGGFDHRRYFMYYEDVDICSRLWRCGWSVVLQPHVTVIHDAQRASHRSIKHLRWHLTSAVRYFSNL